MSDDGLQAKFPLKYQIDVEIMGREDSPEIGDVDSFTSIRTPINKTASFATIALNLRPHFLHSLEEYTRSNMFQTLKVDINIVRNQDDLKSNYPPKVDEVCTKYYLILHVEPLEDARMEAPYTRALLFLTNPVLYWMQCTNAYNIIEEDITVFDALENYESWLKETFGQTAFQFEKVAENYKKNDWEYEQILIRSNNDLMIPTNLIQNYKMFDSYSYYFFDDFRFDENAEADITGYLINLGNLEEIPTKNIVDEDTNDIFAATEFVRGQTLSDPFNVLYQENPSLIIKGYDMQFGFEKAEGKKEVPQLTTQAYPGTYSSTQKATVIKTELSGKVQLPSEQTLLYAPDDPKKAFDRFDVISEQLRKKILAIEEYYMRDSHIDFIQFGNRYNLSPFDITQYAYVPISICNMFVRDSGAVAMFTHNMRFQTFKFEPPE